MNVIAQTLHFSHLLLPPTKNITTKRNYRINRCESYELEKDTEERSSQVNASRRGFWVGGGGKTTLSFKAGPWGSMTIRFSNLPKITSNFRVKNIWHKGEVTYNDLFFFGELFN